MSLNQANPVRKYLLWDTSAVLGYYIPEAARNAKALERARMLIDAVRNHNFDAHFYIPNIVIAETFVQLARLCYSTWDKEINRKFDGIGKTLDTRRYNTARNLLRRDIHNGALFYQHELNRYHILALDLIAPIDKHLKFYRKGNVRSMGASDLLVGSMALHLSRVHGRENVALITCDRRMSAIFDKACASLNPNTANRLGVTAASKEFGFGDWTAGMYPKVIDIARCKESDLRGFLGIWPLKTQKIRGREPKA